MFKLPKRINFLAITIIGLSLIALDPAFAAQESGSIETLKQSTSKEFAQNASAADYLQQGITLLVQNDFRGAEAAFRRAIELDPNDTSAHSILGLALVGQDKLNEAIVEFKQAIHIDPNNADVHDQLGLALVEQGKLNEAVAAYQKARDLYKVQGKTQEANQVNQRLR